MPEKKTLDRARKAKQEGKAPSTQAGAFVEEEMDHVKEGKHGVASKKQAVAIGLSKARRAGVKVKPPPARKSSSASRKKAQRDSAKGHSKLTSHGVKTKKSTTGSSTKRSAATKRASRKRTAR
jgi:hypothetical protein